MTLSYVFFFFKQKTAYEMRISDWSSDVCSSDLRLDVLVLPFATNALDALATIAFTQRRNIDGIGRRRLCRFALHSFPLDIALSAEIGRASCRERVCQYV